MYSYRVLVKLVIPVQYNLKSNISGYLTPASMFLLSGAWKLLHFLSAFPSYMFQQFNWVLCHNFEPNKHNSSRTFWSGSSLTCTMQVFAQCWETTVKQYDGVIIEEQLTNNTFTHLCLEHVRRALQAENVMCATLLSIQTINMHLHAKK